MSTKSKAPLVLTLVAVVAVVLGVVVFANRQSQSGDATIGAIVFLTGPQAALGTEVKNAIDLGVEEVNAAGGIGGKRLVIAYEDSKDQPRDAITAFKRLADRKLPVMIVTGDVVSLNIGPFAAEQAIPVVATVAAGPGIPKKDAVFRVWIQATRQGSKMAEFAAAKLKLKNVSGLHINNEFGEASFGAFKQTFEGSGGKIVATETFGVADRDVRNQITKVVAGNPEAIFVTGFGDGYGAAIKQIRESGYKGQLLTDATLAIPFFRQQTTPASEGAYLATTLYDEDLASGAAANFTKQWRAKYGSEPSFVGAFAYDSLGLIVAVMKKGADTPSAIREGLQATRSFDGVIGPMQFGADGDLEFPLVIKKIEGGKQVLADK